MLRGTPGDRVEIPAECPIIREGDPPLAHLYLVFQWQAVEGASLPHYGETIRKPVGAGGGASAGADCVTLKTTPSTDRVPVRGEVPVFAVTA